MIHRIAPLLATVLPALLLLIASSGGITLPAVTDVVASTRHDGKVWTLHAEHGSNRHIITVSDGASTWDTIVLHPDQRILGLTFLAGKLCLFGYFTSIDGRPGTACAVRWSGSGWRALSPVRAWTAVTGVMLERDTVRLDVLGGGSATTSGTATIAMNVAPDRW